MLLGKWTHPTGDDQRSTFISGILTLRCAFPTRCGIALRRVSQLPTIGKCPGLVTGRVILKKGKPNEASILDRAGFLNRNIGIV
jgi:hypothetical protein